MLTLVVIGLLSGIITGLSPCILPVLPAVLATSAIPPGLIDPSAGEQPKPDRWRPFMVIAGLVTSFAVFTLIGATLLAALGLPGDLLRNIGIAAMLVVGVGFLIPAVGHLLERPFVRVCDGQDQPPTPPELKCEVRVLDQFVRNNQNCQ